MIIVYNFRKISIKKVTAVNSISNILKIIKIVMKLVSKKPYNTVTSSLDNIDNKSQKGYYTLGYPFQIW